MKNKLQGYGLENSNRIPEKKENFNEYSFDHNYCFDIDRRSHNCGTPALEPTT